MKKQNFQNPILNGFYPDPSICRVSEDYYLVTSSFAYYPGLPIFHSRDLIHWEQIGHAIQRPDQLDYKNCEMSLGLWAPTIRYYNGTYYIINTFVSGGREAQRDNYIVTATDPAGPWSDPVFIEGADGIDSSLFFDRDGSIYYTGNYISEEALYEGHHGIYLCRLDPVTFQFASERTVIWDGKDSHSKWIEAPHVYFHNDWYYLIVAEGGTFVNHSVMMARSRHIGGPYEICPRNPILTHRHMPILNEISVTGHADIIETQNGEWWMVLLGVRPYQGGHYNLGRETFLVPVRFAEDGWLMIDNECGLVSVQERMPDLPAYYVPIASPNDEFEGNTLSYLWNSIHPPVEAFYSLSKRPGYLRLSLLPAILHEITTPAFLGRRQQHKVFLASAAMEFNPLSSEEEAGICVLQDDRYHYKMVKMMHQNLLTIRLYQIKNGLPTLLQEAVLLPHNRLYLHIQGNTDTYSFYYGYQEKEYITLSQGHPADLLSSVTNEGFTGAYLGMYASSNGQTSHNYADFDWFHYTGIC